MIGTLLGKSGVTPTASANVAPPAPETRYVPQGAGSLEGSTRVPGGIRTPSGGFIGGTLGEDRLAKLITPKGDITSTANANVNGAPSGETPIPALNLPITTQSLPSTVPLITQAPASYEQLLASNAPGPRPPDVNLDKMLSNLVGGPTMEDLKRRQQSVRY